MSKHEQASTGIDTQQVFAETLRKMNIDQVTKDRLTTYEKAGSRFGFRSSK